VKLTAETVIRCDPETLWRRTQVPEEHARWDLRFSDIAYLPRDDPGAPQRFRYATRIGFGLAIEGWGETIGQGDRRGAALRFGSADAKSLIREGAGCWIFQDDPAGVRFSTVYDYEPRFGRLGRVVDRLLFRPMMVWATRWSFDRLRLWIEEGLAPELALRLWLARLAARTALGLVWIYEGLVPKILAVSPAELAFVARTGLIWRSPELTLAGVGVVETLAGLWLLSGRAERRALTVTTLLMLALTGMVVADDPSTLANPLGGIAKNMCLLACAAVVALLAPFAPNAARAGGRRWGTP
jgi:uncharacterized membrane protein YphA (DoxX/SURF4 family)